jgi:hypothetical protein
MLFVLVLTYGLCAWFSSRSGFKEGIVTTLMSLESEKIIRIYEDGSISSYSKNTSRKKKSVNCINNKLTKKDLK